MAIEMDPNCIENYLTVDEACALSGYSRRYVRKLCADNKHLTCVRKGDWLIWKPSLEDYLLNRKPAGRPPKTEQAT